MIRKFVDSYRHYRRRVGLGWVHALYRAVYFETMHREPWAKPGGSPSWWREFLDALAGRAGGRR